MRYPNVCGGGFSNTQTDNVLIHLSTGSQFLEILFFSGVLMSNVNWPRESIFTVLEDVSWKN